MQPQPHADHPERKAYHGPDLGPAQPPSVPKIEVPNMGKSLLFTMAYIE
jgi:hypothetical protein